MSRSALENKERSWKKSKRTISRSVSTASVDARLSRNTSDRAVTGNQLLANGVYDLWLVVVVLK
jgi:hypothetical protein